MTGRADAAVRRAPGAAYWVARRELHVMVRAPIVYVIGGMFLAVQGVAFAGLVGALSDPRRPAPLGELLEGQLAGTLLTWVLELVVLTLLGMRAIAEDKRTGAWELLLTAQVGEGAAVIGKWLAASAIYALLWLPTLAYLGVIAVYRADAGGWDAAAIACGYLGAIAIGAALLAWAIAASAAMSSTLGAGALGFAWLIGLLLIGELPALWPDLALDQPAIAGALSAISLRETALAFARGELALARLAMLAGLAVVGLSLAIALACGGRRRRGELVARGGGTAAIAAIAAIAAVLAIRHPARLDVSATGRNTLDPATRELLAGLPGPATLTVVQPTVAVAEPIFAELMRVVGRMAEVAPGLAVRAVDPAAAPGGLAAVARAAGLQPTDLARGGAVVVDLAGRRRVVDLFALATISRAADGAPVIEQLAIEQALAGALAALASARELVACATTGHGELPLAPAAGGADWAAIADRARAEGIAVEDIAIGGEVPARCAVVVVAGPVTPLAPGEALAVQAHLRAGRGLVVAAASRPVAGGGLSGTGLEAVLAADGLGLPPAIAVDPALAIRELPGALQVVDGYAEHPINAGFARTRATLWFQPRAVIVERGARPLVSATRASWGETDLVTAPPAKQEDDLAGPVALAAIGSSQRVIAIGSAESLSTAVLGGGASAGDLWLARAVKHLAGAPDPAPGVAARAPDQVRLVLSSGERRAVLALCVVGIPLVWLVGGGGLLWWRRRRVRGGGAG